MGRFSDSPFFFLQNFFDGLSETSRIHDPDPFEFDWPAVFTSSFNIGTGAQSFGDDSYTFDNTTNNSRSVIFTDWRNNSWNRYIYYNTLDMENKIQNSYIVAPFVNITAKGGGLFDLYVKEEDEGFQKITVRYDGRDGDEFRFVNSGIGKIEEGDSIDEIVTSTRAIFQYLNYTKIDLFDLFGNDREAYFRKDSLYHEWLIYMAEDHFLEKLGINLDIRHYANIDKIFHYFHNIFKTQDNQRARIIFDGMKNYVIRAVPEHQRTPAFVELCNVFFDQLYQEIFDLTKNIWSLIDPLEIDDRYLGYLSSYYDMFDMDVDSAPLLQIREFIRDMIWMIKRKGTYTEFYILWRIITATKNILNVYERWHPRDVENFPEWPSTISPPCTGSWPNAPYYSGTNPSITNPKYYSDVWPPPSGMSPAPSGTTVVPASAWVDYLYIYRPEYLAPDSPDAGAGPGWYRREYPEIYNDEIYKPYRNHCPSGSPQISYTPPISGDNLILSPHYIIETDISSEPLTRYEILTKEIWDRMNLYWEYVRPVNRVSHYRIVEAPITDITEKFVHLYEVSSKSIAFLKTRSTIGIGLVDGAYVHVETTIKTTRWVIRHNLNTTDILLQVFDEDLNEIVPKEIEYTYDQAFLTFDTAESGYAIVKKANYVSTRQQPVNDEQWVVYHQQQEKDVIAHFRFNNSGFYTKDTEIYTNTDLGFPRDVVSVDFADTESNTMMVGVPNRVFIQTTAATEWNVGHNLDITGVIMAVYSGHPDDLRYNTRMHPDKYQLINRNGCKIVFDEPTSGFAVFISVGDLSIEAIIEDLIERITTVTYTINPKYNDLNNYIGSDEEGFIKNWYRDDDYFYFNVELDHDATYIINEIKLFDANGIDDNDVNMLFHSLMSDLYKPPQVDMTFHFRLKIGYL